MRFIQKMLPVTICDPTTGKMMTGDGGKVEVKTHDWAMRTAIALAVQEGKLDVLDAIDFRTAWEKHDDCDYVPCEDKIHEVIAKQFRDPKVFGTAYLLSGESHIRAVVDAPSKVPAHVSANGAAAEA